MKKIVKKNQIIITALAALIAVAGYLNHIENSEKALKNTNGETETTTENSGEEVDDAASKDIESNDVDMKSEPGEAVFVSASGNVDFVVEAKLLREQTRANNKEMLMEIVNNTALTENERKQAVDKVAEITDRQEREMAAETLIMAKGFENAVVTITDDEVDVMIVADSLDDAKRAQIEEIVKNKTDMSTDKITITTVRTTGEN